MNWECKELGSRPPAGLKYGFVENLWTEVGNIFPSHVQYEVSMKVYPTLLDEEPDVETVVNWADVLSAITASTQEEEVTRTLEIIADRYHNIPKAVETVYNMVLDHTPSFDISSNYGLYLLTFPMRFAVLVYLHYLPCS
jgi:hypothetical protein